MRLFLRGGRTVSLRKVLVSLQVLFVFTRLDEISSARIDWLTDRPAQQACGTVRAIATGRLGKPAGQCAAKRRAGSQSLQGNSGGRPGKLFLITMELIGRFYSALFRH